jgi:hypothetical protein
MINEHDFIQEQNLSSDKEDYDILFLLKTGKIVKCNLSKEQYDNLLNNRSQLFSGPVVNGTWSEFASFDESQITKWKKT